MVNLYNFARECLLVPPSSFQPLCVVLMGLYMTAIQGFIVFFAALPQRFLFMFDHGYCFGWMHRSWNAQPGRAAQRQSASRRLQRTTSE